MGKYVLDKLLDIREKRQDELVHQVATAKAATLDAQAQLEQEKQALKEFEKQKPERQNKLYAAVMNQVVQRKQLDALKLALAELEQEHLAAKERVEQAENMLRQRQQEQEQLQQELIDATKNKMKLDIHKEEWLEEDRKQEEHKAESDMEDLAKGINSVGDDDDSI